MQKKLSVDQATGIVQVLSLASLLLNLVLRLVLTSEVSAVTLLYDISISTCILLLSPTEDDTVFLSLGLSLGTAVCGAVLAVCSGRIAASMLNLAYIIVFSLWPCVKLVDRLRRMLGDRDFLLDRISGWEFALGFLNLAFALVYVAYTCVACGVAQLSGQNVVVLPFTLVALLYYIFLLSRLLTRMPLQLSSTGDDNFFGEGAYFGFRLTAVPPSKYRRIFRAICYYMEEHQSFLEGNFQIKDLAASLGTNSGYLSRVINACTGLNFNQFVNTYRVKYAMELFKKDTKLKVHELSTMSGFNNKVTFGMAFKMCVELTPGEWCTQYLLDQKKSPQPPSKKRGQER